MPRGLALDPFQRLYRRQLLALCHEIVDGGVRALVLLGAGHGEEEDGVVGDPHGLGGCEGNVEERYAGEEGLGARRAQLVLKFGGGVGGTGGRDDAVEAVDGVCEGDVVDLWGTRAVSTRARTYSVAPGDRARKLLSSRKTETIQC